MEDVVEKYNSGEIAEGSTVIGSGRVGDLWSDPTYNRIDELRYGNQKRTSKIVMDSRMTQQILCPISLTRTQGRIDQGKQPCI